MCVKPSHVFYASALLLCNATAEHSSASNSKLLGTAVEQDSL